METVNQEVEKGAVAEEPAKVSDVAADVADKGTAETAEQKAARDDKGRYSKPPAERIAEITLKHREQERETAYWRNRADAREAKEAEAAKAAAAQKPTPDKYDDYSDYVDALVDWKADQKVDAKFAERDKKSAAEKQAETRSKTWAERTAEVIKVIPTYQQDIDAAADTPIADHVAEILNDSEHGPRVLHHLAKHPDIAERINSLTPTAAAREIGRIEAGFDVLATASTATDAAGTEAEAPSTPTARKTNAPPPAKPVGSGRSTAVNLATASMDEYKAARKAQGARWAR